MSSAESFQDKLFHSATFEGMADANGAPGEEYLEFYRELAAQGVRNIITGCTYVSREGKMVQPGQAGMDDDARIAPFEMVTAAVHRHNAKMYLQISHAGRQTSSSVTGLQVVGASAQRSPYFLSRPKQLSIGEIGQVIEDYAAAALRAKHAGFDGVQIHSAHGYLVHQFLHPGINNRSDAYGINPMTGIGDLFLRKLIAAIRASCGSSYPILVKVCAGDDLPRGFILSNFISLIRLLHEERVHAIEISYGTMEDALNIFRGASIPIDVILRHNFRYKQANPAIRRLWKLLVLPVLKHRLIPFRANYNLPFARMAKRITDIPVICVGGFRKGSEILKAIESGQTDYVSLCRPLIREPDFVSKLCRDSEYESRCVNCNLCAVMCDSGRPTRCYKR